MIIAPHHTWERYIALRYICYQFFVKGPRMILLCIDVTMHINGYCYWFVMWYPLTTTVVATWDQWYRGVKLEQNYSTTIRCVHYGDVLTSMMASQINSLAIVYSTVCSGGDQRKHQTPRHWPLCGEFTSGRRIPHQRANNTENVSICWRHHVVTSPNVMFILTQMGRRIPRISCQGLRQCALLLCTTTWRRAVVAQLIPLFRISMLFRTRDPHMQVMISYSQEISICKLHSKVNCSAHTTIFPLFVQNCIAN